MISGCSQGRDRFGTVAHCSVTIWLLLTGQRGEWASGINLAPASVLVGRPVSVRFSTRITPPNGPQALYGKERGVTASVIKGILKSGMPIIVALRRVK